MAQIDSYDGMDEENSNTGCCWKNCLHGDIDMLS